MSFDKTQIIVETLQGQIDSLQERVRSVAREISEHTGASTICKQLAQTSLNYDALIEKRLVEEEDMGEETQTKIRVYTKNLIVRLHDLCISNEREQRNQVFISQGKQTEMLSQIAILEKTIQKHVAFAKNRAERDTERDGPSEVEEEIMIPAPPVPAPIKVEGASPPKKEEAPTPTETNKDKKPNRRKLSRK